MRMLMYSSSESVAYDLNAYLITHEFNNTIHPAFHINATLSKLRIEYGLLVYPLGSREMWRKNAANGNSDVADRRLFDPHRPAQW